MSLLPLTMFDKLWDQHKVGSISSETDILYIDLHLVHEVSSPQAFEGLKLKGRSVRRPDLTIATVDHNIPTTDRSLPVIDKLADEQIKALESNCESHNILLFGMHSNKQGIVHVIGPELGLTLPGKTIVCGDSHTSTHGAFGTLAFGIGTSEIEHVFATQCIQQTKPKSMNINIVGDLSSGITAKDVILSIISKIGTDGASGTVIEYTGPAIRKMSMEERMTICNMSIEAGARAGMIAPDEKTFDYIKDREFAPKGKDFYNAVKEWEQLRTDDGAIFDHYIEIDANMIEPQVTWGTTPEMGTSILGKVPSPDEFFNKEKRENIIEALEYMDLKPGTPIQEIAIDKVFIGSCTNSRIEDLRVAAKVIRGKKVHSRIHAMVVPGSQSVKLQAEEEGLDQIFIKAGFEWRNSGCSMCLGMNPDELKPGERCASTSNRNFEGRQGNRSRTHLVSPAMAAAAAIYGRFVDIRNL